MYRKTYAQIDNKVLTDNVKKIIKKYNNYKYYIGVVKANAYGHGDYIVNDLIKGGINYLAVSSLEEAISIRKFNKEIPIFYDIENPSNFNYVYQINSVSFVTLFLLMILFFSCFIKVPKCLNRLLKDTYLYQN